MSKERKMALRELDDEISELRRNLTNANYMAQDSLYGWGFFCPFVVPELSRP